MEDERVALEQRVRELEAELASVRNTYETAIADNAATLAALRTSEERFSKAFHASPDSVNLNRLADGVYIAINPGFTALTGYSEADVLGRSSLDLDIWSDPADRARLVDGLRAHGAVSNLAANFRVKDGSLTPGLMSARLIEMDGEPCILSITRDISDRVRSEEALRQSEARLRMAERNEAIGRLAGGIAHDFNNLLTPIMGSASLLLDDPEVGPDARAEAEAILEAAGRAADLTRQILTFGRRQVLNLELLGLNHEIEGMDRMLQRVIGEDIEVQRALGDSLPAIRADRSQIQQVLLNLAVNARDAMPRGGRLSLGTSMMDADEVTEALAPGLRPGARYVRLDVADTGVGIDAQTLPHIFEPFFTTKPSGQGTGLGLATVRGIVEQHGGALWAVSTPGIGTTFTICFPAAADSSSKEAKGPTLPERRRGSETILLVEDDAAVRRTVQRLLAEDGYHVLVAHNGAEALEIGATLSQPPGLLLTDVIMPGMDGRQLRDRLVERFPALRVLYVSGYPENILAPHGVLDADTRLLGKPFTAAGLSAAVRAAIDEA